MTLTASEQARLENLEAVIEAGLQTFIEVGNALIEIRETRLYRAAYPNFYEYCQARWGRTRQWAHIMMTAAQVAETVKVSTTVDIPLAAARALTAYPESLHAAIVTIAAADDDLSGKHVTSIAETFMQLATTGTVNGDTAFSQAVLVEDYETAMRQRQHIADASRWKHVARRVIERGRYRWIVTKLELK